MDRMESAHSRINELMVLHDFMSNANIKSNSKQAETIMEYWSKYNMPYTKQYDKSSKRAHFTRGENFPLTPDTLHVKKGDLDDWIAELSHAIQFNTSKEVRDSLYDKHLEQVEIFGDQDRYGYTDKHGNKWFRTDLSDRALTPLNVPPNRWSVYKEEGGQKVPVEFDAHSIIEPLIKKDFQDAALEDMGANKNILNLLIKKLGY